MNKMSNTEKAFSAMKETPVEISTDAVRNIVMTSAVASVTVSKASIIAKLIHTKFHLNSIIAMTSFLSASIVGGVLLFSGLHSDHLKNTTAINSLTKNTPENPELASRPDISLAVDTPQKGQQIVIINDVNSGLPNDSNAVIRIVDDGHGRSITRIIRLDSNQTMAMNRDSMMIPQTNMQTYTYTYNSGHGHKRGRGKNSNCIVINESQMISDANLAMADANLAIADAELARNDSAMADAQRAYAYAYSDAPATSGATKGKTKCVVVTGMDDMDFSTLPAFDSLPNLDQNMTIISNADMGNMHGNHQVTIVKQGPGLGGNDMSNQMVILNDDGPQVAICNGGGMSADSMLQKLTEKLFADKLIADQKHFTFTIDGKSLKINGSKQSDDIFQQYKTYIETISSNKVDKHFLYDLSVNGNQMKLTVNNYSNN